MPPAPLPAWTKSHCREPYRPDERELGRFGLMASREADVTFYRAHHHGPNEPVCHCQGSGYKGRVGIYEVLRRHADVIRQLALESGW